MKGGFGISFPVTVVVSAIAFIHFSTVFIFIDRWFGRAHHCRVCKRCVLRMDHHCIWINNCIGHANYKEFFVFSGSLANDSPNDEQQTADFFGTADVISGLLLVPLSVALSVLLGWHICLILQNKTTVEYHEGVIAKLLAEKGVDVYKHPYDLGAYENLVLGPSIFCWICPTSRHIGNGLCFQSAYDRISAASTSK